MNLTIAELNEVIYCIGRTIADDPKGWNIEQRQARYNRLYGELEERLSHLAQPNFWSAEDQFDNIMDYERRQDQIQQAVDEYTHLRDYEPDGLND